MEERCCKNCIHNNPEDFKAYCCNCIGINQAKWEAKTT